MQQEETKSVTLASQMSATSDVILDEIDSANPLELARMETITQPESKKFKLMPFVRKICCFWTKIFSSQSSSKEQITVGTQEELLNLLIQLQNSTVKPVLKPVLTSRKTLVLDLDQTLVHTKFYSSKCDFSSSINVNGQKIYFYTTKRQGVQKFIKQASKLYQLIVFTAGVQDYAEKIVQLVDPNQCIKHILSRDHCIAINRMYIKNLKLINRDLCGVILLDNSLNSGLLQPDNLLHIKSYFGDQDDKQLYRVLEVLKYLNKLQDVRPLEQQRQKCLQRKRNKQNQNASSKAKLTSSQKRTSCSQSVVTTQKKITHMR